MNLNDTMAARGGRPGQAGRVDAVCRLFGCKDLPGLMTALQSKGLGRQVKSWVSTGQNQQVTGAEIRKAADPAMLRMMAKEQEMSPEELCDQVARALPQLVDQATTDGMAPPPGVSAAGGMAAAKGGAPMKGSAPFKDSAKRMKSVKRK